MNNIEEISEKNFSELENKIEELREFAKNQGMDFSYEISRLEKKLKKQKEEYYRNLSPWERVKIAREIKRPTALDYINHIFDNFVELKGDRYFADDKAIIGGIASFKDIPVTVIGEQKGKDTSENIMRNFGMPNPEGYRKSLRLMKQAEKFHRPIICFVDTPGAFCGIGAEERGQGEAIARNLFELSDLKVPIISIFIGEGGSGGALAISVADRILMMENSIFSILSPEGFAAILWKNADRAKEAAEVMKITSKDLLELKVIDGVIKEPLGGAHLDLDAAALNIKEAIEINLKELKALNIEELVSKRYERFRNI